MLAEFGSNYHDIIKMNAYYVGAHPDDLHRNLNIRSSCFTAWPGLASTGIPLNNLAYPGMFTEFESIAMIDENSAEHQAQVSAGLC